MADGSSILRKWSGRIRTADGRCLVYYYMSTDYLPPPWRLMVAGDRGPGG